MEVTKGTPRKRPSKAQLIIGAIIVLVTLTALYYVFNPPAKNTAGQAVATVWIDGQEFMRIPLDPEADTQTIDLEEYGKPILLEVENGKIRFLQAKCPDQICVHTGFISMDGQMAACMPNRTSVTVTID